MINCALMEIKSKSETEISKLLKKQNITYCLIRNRNKPKSYASSRPTLAINQANSES